MSMARRLAMGILILAAGAVAAQGDPGQTTVADGGMAVTVTPLAPGDGAADADDANAEAIAELKRLVPHVLPEFVGPAPLASATDEQKAMYERARTALLASGRAKVPPLAESNESWFFVLGHHMLPLMDAYAYSRDPEYVEILLGTLDAVLAQRWQHPTEPDVWTGWWHYQDNGAPLRYMPIHGAIMYYRPALKLIAAVRADPELQKKYAPRAVKLFRDITELEIPGWDRRGSWHDLGDRGGYYTHTTHYPDRETGNLVKREDQWQGSTLAYNKVHEFVEALVLLDRMTENPWYRTRATACMTFFRSHWREKDDHVEWNYRDMSGPWDYKNGRDGETKTGYFVHPKGGYYAADLEAIVRCYDNGIVFTEADMRRLVETNLKFMYRGDHPPTFRKINGSYTEEGKYGKGHLWTSLARFSPEVRSLWAEQLKGDRVYGWQNRILGYLIATSRPVSWEPMYARKAASATGAGANGSEADGTKK